MTFPSSTEIAQANSSISAAGTNFAWLIAFAAVALGIMVLFMALGRARRTVGR